MRGRDMVRITIGEPGGDQQTVIMPRLLAATLAETRGAGATGLSVPSYVLEAYRKRVRQLRVFGISIEESRGRLVLGTPITFVEALDA